MSTLDREDALSCASEDFLDLLCAQEDLLDAEFEAIIAANWPDAPPPPSPRGVGGGGHRDEPPRSTDGRLPDLGDGWRFTDPWSRQRSPPRKHARERRSEDKRR